VWRAVGLSCGARSSGVFREERGLDDDGREKGGG